MQHVIIPLITLIVGLLVGGFLMSYLQKKGENLATHEDIEKLVDQVKAVTQATKEIESKISGELWDRQKRWELKREAVFEAMKRLSADLDSLVKMASVWQTEVKHPELKGVPSWEAEKTAARQKRIEAATAFEESTLLVGLTCEKAVSAAIVDYHRLTTEVAVKVAKDDVKVFEESFKKMLELRDAVGEALRKDLGIG